MPQRNLDLTELVNLEEWQKIQDTFSDALEVTLRTISLDGKLLSKISRPNHLCNEVLSGFSGHSAFCTNHLLEAGPKEPLDIKKKASFKCALGLDIFVVPIKATGNRIAAYIIAGPLILKKRKDASEYAKNAKKFGIDLEKLVDALIEINVFSHNKAYSIIQLIETIFSHMAQTEYHKRRLGKLAPEIMEMDPLFSRYYEEKILSALLNSCTLALDADSGSVMTLDENTNTLHIKVSSKLDERIRDNTSIKVGEGIAGLAAATARPIILPKDEGKNGLSGKLKRKYIKSSMIIPFSKDDSRDIRCVINLNIVRKEKDFSEKDIAIVKELANLASIALVPLRPAKIK